MKKNKKTLEEIKINKTQEVIISSLEEFENKFFDINDKVNFYSTINMHLKGEKSKTMAAKYNDFKRKLKENEIKDKIKNVLEESSICKQMNEINLRMQKIKDRYQLYENLNQINDLIDKNIEDIKSFQSDDIDLIEEYGEFFDLNLIMKEFDLSSL